MAKMSRPTVLDQLHGLMKDAAEIDIEAGYFKLSGWHMLVKSRKIPLNVRIRLIAGKVPVALSKPELVIPRLISAAGISKNPEDHQFALKDMALRIFGRGPYLPNLEIGVHRDNHRKVYIARKKRKLWKSNSRILVGSANLSKEGFKQHAKIYNEGLWRARRFDARNIEREFERNWERCRKVDTRRFLRVVRENIQEIRDLIPPEDGE